jgi:hypothetical protein
VSDTKDQKDITSEPAPPTPSKTEHAHVWATFVSGDGSAATRKTLCTFCQKEK